MHRLLQYTLDLFDAPAPADPALPPKSAAPGGQPRRRTKTRGAGTAVPIRPAGEGALPENFRHPQASRETVLRGARVAYEFRRARRRTIGFMVGPEGLTVAAPRWVPLYEVEAAVQSKAAWILQKLGAAQDRQQRIESARIEWRDGATFPFLGEPVVVVLEPRRPGTGAGAELHADACALPGLPRLSLHMGLAQTATPAQVREGVRVWLMGQAERLFTDRLHHFAPRLGVQWHKLSLSNAGTRWGTAQADGSIRLNWRLIHFDRAVVDYVVVHELSHLRVMDHSPRFWATVGQIVPDYERLRRQLREETLPPW